MNQNKEKIISFKDGIPGFKYLRKFILLEDENTNFCYLQSLEEETVCFTLINPHLIMEDYAPCIGESYFERLGGGLSEDYALFNIITIREPIEESTVNLQAPLLIHIKKLEGIQALTEGDKYKIRHKLIEVIEERNQSHVSLNT